MVGQKWIGSVIDTGSVDTQTAVVNFPLREDNGERWRLIKVSQDHDIRKGISIMFFFWLGLATQMLTSAGDVA